MASLARGFCLPGLRPLLVPRAESLLLRSRFFSTSLLRAAEPAIKSTQSPNTSRAAAAAAAAAASKIAPSRYAFMKSLASKPTPTVIYEGPSHFWFYFGCWSSGISLIAWTGLTAPYAVQQPEGVPQWIGLVFGTAYLLLASMGTFMITKTPNIVGQIRILPAQVSKLAAATPGPAPIQMELTIKRMVPMLKPKVVVAPLNEVALASRFSLPEEYVPGLRRIELEQKTEAQRKALHKFDMQHLFTMPFRRMGRALSAMFNGVKSAWTDMGFGIIIVDGKKYKVDVTKGYAHDGFRTLEKLVEIKH
ncbi:hypothetical protein NXS19_012337 [Fusarium pseudograminearum]|uniref:Uncharacterized protein n=1 Tax=Fusarium pseudograminearum (strain CS3096) TaxID=1028729 RepID=K3W1W3_FUSPC|nr:hypothetical protein FPSE_03150 [Fusarium pseudograminearum CS3096]EKJ76600.1 hypothetical protein FPSE_03150 [Fusarium pseudograminearum CS3096]KAF0641095.1 hypothetical protein FPSE5266_03150 [Fusarium pseudograminearum]UZP44525.1 hypothetical protein NXS19_012337 [Fusarium pseudograminearum]